LVPSKPVSSDEEALPDALRADRRPFIHHAIYDAADWYDVDYAAYKGELTFYRLMLQRHAREGRAVVEGGAGTGRLTVPLAQSGSGFTVHAVEPSAAMRARLAARVAKAGAVVTIEDARADTFTAPPNTGLVIFPFNGVLHLPHRAALDAFLQHARRALVDGGCVALDLTPPYWEVLLRGQLGWGRIDERIHSENGRRFLTCDRTRYLPATRSVVIDVRYAYVDGDDPGTQIELVQRMWTTPEIEAALDDNGFDVDACFGDVDLASFDDGSPRLLIGAKKR
jgi:SAM-dependent methyltransferase